MSTDQLLVRLRCSTLIDARKDAAKKLTTLYLSNEFSLDSSFLTELIRLGNDSINDGGILVWQLFVDMLHKLSPPTPPFPSSDTAKLSDLYLAYKSQSLASTSLGSSSDSSFEVLSTLPTISLFFDFLNSSLLSSSLTSLQCAFNFLSIYLSIFPENSVDFFINHIQLLNIFLEILKSKMQLQLIVLSFLISLTSNNSERALPISKVLLVGGIFEILIDLIAQNSQSDQNLVSDSIILAGILLKNSNSRSYLAECGHLSKLTAILPIKQVNNGQLSRDQLKIAKLFLGNILIPLTRDEKTCQKFVSKSKSFIVLVLSYSLLPLSSSIELIELENSTQILATLCLINISDYCYRLVSDATFFIPKDLNGSKFYEILKLLDEISIFDVQNDCLSCTGFVLLIAHVMSQDWSINPHHFELLSRILNRFDKESEINLAPINRSFLTVFFNQSLIFQNDELYYDRFLILSCLFLRFSKPIYIDVFSHLLSSKFNFQYLEDQIIENFDSKIHSQRVLYFLIMLIRRLSDFSHIKSEIFELSRALFDRSRDPIIQSFSAFILISLIFSDETFYSTRRFMIDFGLLSSFISLTSSLIKSKVKGILPINLIYLDLSFMIGLEKSCPHFINQSDYDALTHGYSSFDGSLVVEQLNQSNLIVADLKDKLQVSECIVDDLQGQLSNLIEGNVTTSVERCHNCELLSSQIDGLLAVKEEAEELYDLLDDKDEQIISLKLQLGIDL
ncbi:hypothetical protein RCL1_003619 [Eukaryota sp. TZLM3-RCL]